MDLEMDRWLSAWNNHLDGKKPDVINESESPVDLNELQREYWAYLYERNESPKKIAKGIADSPNPEYPTSIGKDQDNDPFRDISDIEKLAVLKIRVDNLQNKVAKMDGKDDRKVQKQISDLMKQIENISNSLGQQSD